MHYLHKGQEKASGGYDEEIIKLHSHERLKIPWIFSSGRPGVDHADTGSWSENRHARSDDF